ncbi:MAG: hypothetical protein PHE89_06505 [Alphaproteobacteria bacterium]|nr:hypothetical protein [Alphaproteobacteria bacterium]
MESENKFRIYVLFLSTVILFSLSWLSVSYRDTYLTLWATKNNFQEKIARRMKFVYLDYMNDEQVVACEALYNHLKANNDKLKFLIPVFSLNINQLNNNLNLNCEAVSSLKAPYKSYLLEDDLFLIMGKNDEDGLLYQYVNGKTCQPELGLENRNIMVSKNNVVVEVYGKKYLISEWFSKDKFVFFYLDKDRKFDEVVCRFDVVVN